MSFLDKILPNARHLLDPEPGPDDFQAILAWLEEQEFSCIFSANLNEQGQRFMYQRGPTNVILEWDPSTGIEFAVSGMTGHTLAELQRALGTQGE